MSDKVFLGETAKSIKISPVSDKYSKVVVIVSQDENGDQVAFEAGDNSGNTLEITNPWGTQQIANDILARVKDFSYLPFSAESAKFDTAAELGDGITVSGVYSMISSQDIRFDSMTLSDVSSPYDEEMNHEYPFISHSERSLTRRIASNSKAILSVTNSAIEAEVSRATGEEASIREYAESITLSVTNGTSSSTIRLMAGETVIQSRTIRFSGMVTFSDLSTAGETTIIGDNITTGTINALNVNFFGEDGGNGGGFKVATGKSGAAGTTYGAKMYGANSEDKYYVIATNSGVRLQADSTYLYCINNSIHTSSAIINDSDRRVKNSIDYNLDRYMSLLLSLKPCVFRYNNGASHRFHPGFIAQDVEQALTDIGMTGKDFAGLVVLTDEEIGLDDEEELSKYPRYGLRYEEFVALNTYAVQKALLEIDELKNAIKQFGGAF